MKNTTWYCHVNLKPLGPLTQEELRGKIHRGEVGPQDLICDDSGVWKPAAEWGVFEFQLFPAVQSYVPGLEVDENLREWVLLVEQKGAAPLQEGPFSVVELKGMLSSGVTSPYQYVWKSGLSGWCQLKDRPEFAAVITSKSLSNPSRV